MAVSEPTEVYSRARGRITMCPCFCRSRNNSCSGRHLWHVQPLSVSRLSSSSSSSSSCLSPSLRPRFPPSFDPSPPCLTPSCGAQGSRAQAPRRRQGNSLGSRVIAATRYPTLPTCPAAVGMAAIQADGGPALSASLPAFRVNTENGTDTAMHSAKMSTPATSSGAQVHDKNIPLSARKGQRLDLATVERRGPGAQNRPSTRSERLFGLTEAPTFRPTLDEFKDPMAFIDSIREEGQRYGIVKIIPPDSWEPPFAVDTEVRATVNMLSLVVCLHAVPVARRRAHGLGLG